MIDKDTEEFELPTILSVITGINCVDDFTKVYKLIWFACNDNLISPLGLGIVTSKVKKHLLHLYPEFKKIKFKKGDNIDKIIFELQKEYGCTLPVTKVGIDLPEKEYVKKIK